MIELLSYAEILSDPNWPNLELEYAAECSLPELGKPCPQPELYALLESSGGFQAFGVIDKGTLVGFATVMGWTLPHYGKKIAATESIFVTKSRRGMGHGLMRNIEEYASQNHCEAFQYIAPVGSQFDVMLAASDSYRHTNNVYMRKL